MLLLPTVRHNSMMTSSVTPTKPRSLVDNTIPQCSRVESELGEKKKLRCLDYTMLSSMGVKIQSDRSYECKKVLLKT